MAIYQINKLPGPVDIMYFYLHKNPRYEKALDCYKKNIQYNFNLINIISLLDKHGFLYEEEIQKMTGLEIGEGVAELDNAKALKMVMSCSGVGECVYYRLSDEGEFIAKLVKIKK